MNSVAVVLIVVGFIIVVIVAVVAWLLYKAGFKVTEVTTKTGPLEAKMKRNPDEKPSKAESPTSRVEVYQKAGRGGVICESGISAPGQSNARIEQHSNGKGSRIDDSPIKLS
ncbi:MAG: hypothetical protein DRI77_04535 [Chloroflexi bacterium]|nr:MAG: hypothetical protein DRI77_04535 [Chloroflexota bacterium]